MIKAASLFESYNMAVEKGYNCIFDNNENIDILNLNDKELFKLVEKDVKAWEATQMSDLGGITPAEFFGSIEDTETLMDLFKTGAVMCNYDLPSSLLDRLKAFREEIYEELLSYASNKNSITHDVDFLISLMSIRVLGQWSENRAIEPLMKFFINEMHEYDVNYDIIAEELADCFVNMGVPAVEPLLKALESHDNIDSNLEYLLKALSDIGKANKSDSIFYCLKNAFRKMDNKTLAALFIKNYGDSRAIPLLRGYLEKNVGGIDNETFYEIKHVVESLGGNIGDLNQF